MPAPKVTFSELDLTTKVPSFPGVYGALAIDSPRGPLAGTLVTNETDLLKWYTFDGTLKVGYDLAFYSALAFLQASNKLWVKRVERIDAAWAGFDIQAQGTKNVVWASGVTTDPKEGYTFRPNVRMVVYGANPGVWADSMWYRIVRNLVEQSTVLNGSTVDLINNGLKLAPNVPLYTGQKVRLSIAGGAIPSGLDIRKAYYLRVTPEAVPSPTYVLVQFYTTYEGSLVDYEGDVPFGQLNFRNPVVLVDTGSGTITLKQDLGFESQSNYLIQIATSQNESAVTESFEFSLDPDGRDGDNRQVFADDISEGSPNVRLKVNLTMTEDLEPQYEFKRLGGGDDGAIATDAEYVNAIDTFANKTEFPLTLIMDGGHATENYHREITIIAEQRMDCFGILSTPFDKESSANYLNELVEYRREALNVSTSFSGLFSPHLKIFNKYTDREDYVAPDGYVGALISLTAVNYEIWYPPAGFTRGRINVNDVHIRYTDGEMDYITDNQINPIRFAPGRGVVLWGQRTLLAADSALARINVRMLGIVIGQAVTAFLQDFIYELNDEPTRARARVQIESYMADIQARRGVYEYLVKCDDENNTPTDIDNYKMNVWLFIKPVRGVEFIPFKLIYTPTGMSFGLALQLAP